MVAPLVGAYIESPIEWTTGLFLLKNIGERLYSDGGFGLPDGSFGLPDGDFGLPDEGFRFVRRGHAHTRRE